MPNLSSFYPNLDKILFSSGPENGFLCRGEPVDIQKMDFLKGLKCVFKTGFQNNSEGEGVFPRLLYGRMSFRREDAFFSVSSLFAPAKDQIGWENEECSRGECGYVYIIDSHSSHSLEMISLTEENIPLLLQERSQPFHEEVVEAPEHAVFKKTFEPNLIIGAVPSPFIAKYALNIPELSFIRNPNYKGVICFEGAMELSQKVRLWEVDTLQLDSNFDLHRSYQLYRDHDKATSTATDWEQFFSGLKLNAAFESSSIPSPLSPSRFCR